LVGSEVSNRADLLKKPEDSFDEDDLDQEEDSESRALETSIKLARAKKRKAVCSEVALDDQDEIAEFEKAPDAKLRILQVLQQYTCVWLHVHAVLVEHSLPSLENIFCFVTSNRSKEN